MADSCSIFLENPEGALLLLKIGSGGYKGQWCLPGDELERNEEPQEAIHRICTEQLGVEVELFPYRKVVRYVDYASHVFKGRILGGSIALGQGYSDWRWTTYEELPHLDLAPFTEADVGSLPADFLATYDEGGVMSERY